MQTMWVTRLPFNGQWIRMTDADATTGNAHHWAYRNPPNWTIPQELIDEAIESFDPVADQPSFDEWLGRAQSAEYDPSGGGSTPPTPKPPTAVHLDPNTVDSDAGANTPIGVLSATDPDPDEFFTYSVEDPYFTISGLDGTQLIKANAQDPPVGNYVLPVKVTDSHGLTYDGNVTVNVTA